MFQPMAVAMIFGLVVSTLLTLGLVPILYAFFFRVRFDGYVYARATQAGGGGSTGRTGANADRNESSGKTSNGVSSSLSTASTWAQMRRWINEQVGGSGGS